jgi:hypothetical protein
MAPSKLITVFCDPYFGLFAQDAEDMVLEGYGRLVEAYPGTVINRTGLDIPAQDFYIE